MGNEINEISETNASSIESSSKGKTVTEKYADVTLRLIEEHGDSVDPLSPEQEKKVRRKLYLRLMGLLSTINIMLFVCSLFRHCALSIQANILPFNPD
jgi:hypothetical protein